jgi:hypothetical protein
MCNSRLGPALAKGRQNVLQVVLVGKGHHPHRLAIGCNDKILFAAKPLPNGPRIDAKLSAGDKFHRASPLVAILATETLQQWNRKQLSKDEDGRTVVIESKKWVE